MKKRFKDRHAFEQGGEKKKKKTKLENLFITIY